jgi:hypothetical protein
MHMPPCLPARNQEKVLVPGGLFAYNMTDIRSR